MFDNIVFNDIPTRFIYCTSYNDIDAFLYFAFISFHVWNIISTSSAFAIKNRYRFNIL